MSEAMASMPVAFRKDKALGNVTCLIIDMGMRQSY